MKERIKQMLIKEFLQMFRDKRMRMVIMVMPLVQLTILSMALTTDVKNIKVAIVDRDNTVESRSLISGFSDSQYFDVAMTLRDDSRLPQMLDKGEVLAAISIPYGFSEDLKSGKQSPVQIICDGIFSNDTAIIMNYAGQATALFNSRHLEKVAGKIADAVNLEGRAWYNPNLESKYYYVPGLIAVMLILVGLVLTSMAIVREKEIGTIEQVMVTPIRKSEFIIGKTLPFLITGYVTMTLMFIIAYLVFGIRIQGSLLLLYACSGVYITGNLGLALLVSVTARTQQQALLTAFLIIVPAILLSGFIFPIHNMPEGVQAATIFNPMRWYLLILHSIALKGVGAESLIKPIIAQAALAAGFLSLAIMKFQKTID
ncbi:ABC-2 type transporter [Desulfatibacillum aliphaticivorans]|uniref:ABC-2 type transporter n=1 Tax=Desulfatibacillum aliphaticivorans TaxID=218208 RepID=B8FG43_DESAL|nr:ABC transporter permease [Desulfatibacillum aliphaticivorans]ACL03723.1 ABC-2 type transporter [Desulfatibacillum aliphaticivorans]